MKRLFLALVIGLGVALPAWALEIAGVQIPDSTPGMATGEQLQLNGAGIRRKFIFKIYIGGLYLPQKADSLDKVLALPGSKRVLMHFLYKEIEKSKLDAAWREGLEDNLSKEELVKLEPALQQFTALFSDVKEGDRIWIDQLTNGATRVTLNDKVTGEVSDPELYRGLMKMWLGEDPVTTELKQGMLGKQ